MIAYWYTNRAEEGLILPVVNELRRREYDVKRIVYPEFIDVTNLGDLYYHAYRLFQRLPPDLVLLGFDRYEALMVTLAAYYQNIPVAQMHAGDISMEGSWDDNTRHAITLYSTLQFCNGDESYHRTLQLLELAGKPMDKCFEVGSTALDDIEPSDELVPKTPYVLVLYNPPTRRLDLMEKELQELEEKLREIDLPAVWVAPNGDPGSEKILDFRMRCEQAIFSVSNLKRDLFLGLMKQCEYYIGNSSSLFLEGPFFLPKDRLIHIGVRNKGRQFITIQRGGSKRIVKHLERVLEG